MNITIVGAGGITNTMISTFCKIIGDKDSITIIDGDQFEAKNAVRQVFCIPGRFKAEVIAEECKRLGVKNVQAVNRYIREVDDLAGAEMIISCVDNNDTRAILKEYSDEYSTFLIVGGNEADMGSAFVYHADLPTLYPDSFVPDGEHPAESCTSAEFVLENEQTPWANHVAGTGILTLFLEWRDFMEDQEVDTDYRATSFVYTTHSVNSTRLQPNDKDHARS